MHPPIAPMQAAAVERLPDPDSCPGGCCYEPKWDGYRCMIFAHAGGVHLQSRALKPLTGYFPDIAAAAAGLLPAGSIADGELIIWDGRTGRTSFPLLHRRLTAGTAIGREAAQHPAHLVLFDLLHDGTNSLQQRPLHERRTRLQQLLADAAGPVTVCPQTRDPAEAQAWLRDWASAGIEGIVIKGWSSRYRPGHRGWRKLHSYTAEDVIVGGYTGPQHAPATLLLGRLDDAGSLRYAGRTRPLAAHLRRELGALLELMAPAATEPHPWPQPLPAGWSGQWNSEPLAYHPVKPYLVVEVAADTAYEYGRWRHPPKLVRPRPDLDPGDVQEHRHTR